MKILHLIPNFDFGGTELLVRSLAAAQEVQGAEVCVAGFREPPGPLVNTFNRVKIFPPHNTTLSVFRRAAVPEELQSFILDWKPDIIHSHSAWTDIILAGCRLGEISQISHFHLIYDIYEKKPIRSISALKVEIGRQLLFWRQRRNNTRYIACSAVSAKYYKENLPESQSARLHVVPNFCRLGLADNPRRPPDLNRLSLLCVSRLEKHRNISFAIDVAASLVSDLKINAYLKVAGTGRCADQLKRHAEQRGIGDRVTFLGGVHDVQSLYDSADILIHPSQSETFGLVLVEAMARGLPCFANSDLLAAQSAFGSGEAGVLEPVEDPHAFARSISNFVHSDAYSRTSEKGILRARDFSIQDYVKEIFRVYSLSAGETSIQRP